MIQTCSCNGYEKRHHRNQGIDKPDYTAIADIRESVIKALLNENAALKARVRNLEIEVAGNLQYQRRKNIVVSGIATDNVEEMMEPAVVDILKKVDVIVSPRDIEAVHKIGKDSKRTIVRFRQQKGR